MRLRRRSTGWEGYQDERGDAQHRDGDQLAEPQHDAPVG
jgi:hypothetical protein